MKDISTVPVLKKKVWDFERSGEISDLALCCCHELLSAQWSTPEIIISYIIHIHTYLSSFQNFQNHNPVFATTRPCKFDIHAHHETFNYPFQPPNSKSRSLAITSATQPRDSPITRSPHPNRSNKISRKNSKSHPLHFLFFPPSSANNILLYFRYDTNQKIEK